VIRPFEKDLYRVTIRASTKSGRERERWFLDDPINVDQRRQNYGETSMQLFLNTMHVENIFERRQNRGEISMQLFLDNMDMEDVLERRQKTGWHLRIFLV